jgi:predicted nucleic acid-binding protein
MERYILDSNTAIYLLNGTLNTNSSKVIASIANKPFMLSVISRIELLGWKAPNKKQIKQVKNFVKAAIILDLDEDVVIQTIEIRRKYKIKPNRRTVPDAIIAATAMVHDLTLITRNMADFDSIDGLLVVNPFEQ